MHGQPPIIIDVLNDLDGHVAAELLTVLRSLCHALEQHYPSTLRRQQQRDWETRQSSLWLDDDPPF